jgi:hypothetical protein
VICCRRGIEQQVLVLQLTSGLTAVNVHCRLAILNGIRTAALLQVHPRPMRICEIHSLLKLDCTCEVPNGVIQLLEAVVTYTSVQVRCKIRRKRQTGDVTHQT